MEKQEKGAGSLTLQSTNPALNDTICISEIQDQCHFELSYYFELNLI